MREIKFRCWDLCAKKWDLDGIWWCKDDKKNVFTMEPQLKGGWVISQFTGLLDSKGAEIFEGDVLKLPLVSVPPEIFEVLWDARYGTWIMIEKSRPRNLLLYEMGNRCKIIGNIYENPELLNDNDNTP